MLKPEEYENLNVDNKLNYLNEKQESMGITLIIMSYLAGILMMLSEQGSFEFFMMGIVGLCCVIGWMVLSILQNIKINKIDESYRRKLLFKKWNEENKIKK